MTDNDDSQYEADDDMAQYLQTFLDETDEQLDDLIETMLLLEQDVTNESSLNEAFRLVHSIKGSAGMMGLDNITVLTHHLENRFERFRSGVGTLDEPTMNLVLRCIDFLRQCNIRLRRGERLPGPTELLAELQELEERTVLGEAVPQISDDIPFDSEVGGTSLTDELTVTKDEDLAAVLSGPIRMGAMKIHVRFQQGLQLTDLKAQLIAARLSRFGDIQSTRPDLSVLTEQALSEELSEFTIELDYQGDTDPLRDAADVDGVAAITFAPSPVDAAATLPDGPEADEPEANRPLSDEPDAEEFASKQDVDHELRETSSVADEGAAVPAHADDAAVIESEVSELADELPSAETKHADEAAEPSDKIEPLMPAAQPPSNVEASSAGSKPKTSETAAAKVTETMRVDIDRLDNLMNLAGELVVNRARFMQISERVDPAFRKATMAHRLRNFADTLAQTIASLRNNPAGSEQAAQIHQLQAGLELLEEQAVVWESGRQCLGDMSEAIDQLSRVSHSLQREVLETRMVPVGPLFNRFKRVVRDLSRDRGKQVELTISGDKTEIDKRMIDELGDPLVHLVRNSIDHGLEPTETRLQQGKPSVGNISLDASHSGNHVFIRIQDDGRGIDTEKIKSRLVENGVLTSAAAEQLSPSEAMDYIWDPGFSTASEVTDVSGRGVGMDVVKTRLGLLNGSIEVDSRVAEGTTFTIRLPLTLAIIDCLLVQMRGVMFSIPTEDVREIVSVPKHDIRTVQGMRTFDVRGEFLPLVDIQDVFHWHDVGDNRNRRLRSESNGEKDGEKDGEDVVILSCGDRKLGLLVDDLHGSQDIVIKSLSDNFVDIRGLSGASILGDGSVCLMLDAGRAVDMVLRSSRISSEASLP